MVDLVRVKDKFQVTIPAAVRRHLAVREGDYLEASVSGDGIVFRPQQPGQTSPRDTRTILDFLSEPLPKGRSRKEIDKALKADRDAWDK